jgi:hypothetical protein
MGWNRPGTNALAVLLLAGLLLPAPALAQRGAGADASPPPPSYAAAAFDVVLLRPVGLAVAAISAAFFVPAAIVAAPGGRDAIQHAWDLFVIAPGQYVFTRPLGKF